MSESPLTLEACLRNNPHGVQVLVSDVLRRSLEVPEEAFGQGLVSQLEEKLPNFQGNLRRLSILTYGDLNTLVIFSPKTEAATRFADLADQWLRLNGLTLPMAQILLVYHGSRTNAFILKALAAEWVIQELAPSMTFPKFLSLTVKAILKARTSPVLGECPTPKKKSLAARKNAGLMVANFHFWLDMIKEVPGIKHEEAKHLAETFPSCALLLKGYAQAYNNGDLQVSPKTDQLVRKYFLGEG